MWYISYVCTGDRIVSGIVFHNCFNTVTARITFTSILNLQCMCIIYIIYTHLIVMRVGNWRCLQTAVYVHVYKVWSGFPPHVHSLIHFLVFVQIYSGKDLTDEMTRIQTVLSDDKNDWEDRVVAVCWIALQGSIYPEHLICQMLQWPEGGRGTGGSRAEDSHSQEGMQVVSGTGKQKWRHWEYVDSLTGVQVSFAMDIGLVSLFPWLIFH